MGHGRSVAIKVDQVYDFEVETNRIVSQSVAADQKIKRQDFDSQSKA